MASASLRVAEGRARLPAVPIATVAAALLALFAVDNVALLAFLGLAPVLVAITAAAAVAGIALLGRRMLHTMPQVPVSTVAAAIALALVLLMLGGEGRLFFANADWQIRDAVLADLARQPWPFAYQTGGGTFILRAPLGMYLLPSLAGSGRAADLALLASNSLRLGLCFTLGWALFDSTRARATALVVFVLFSGWDVLGTLLRATLGARTNWDHLESWNVSYQYSSHVTQLFWVPHHALAGWICAVTFLLWRSGKASIGLFAATIPLVALWSPLAVIGAVPFAAFAGFEALRHRTYTRTDIALAGVALAVSLPSLAYMQLDAAEVGGGFSHIPVIVYIFCIAFEVLPFVYPLLRDRSAPEVDRPVVWLILLCLLAAPLFQIGQSGDFQMRASIMPLALLAIAFAKWLVHLIEAYPARKAALWFGIAAILIGAATPLAELRRSLTQPTSPPPLCSLVDVWTAQSGVIVAMSTYLARTEALPPFMLPVPVTVRATKRAQCWARPWPDPRPWGGPLPSGK